MLYSLLGVSEWLGISNYLGLPFMIGKNKKSSFNYIKHGVWRKIIFWSGKAFSKAGREVLVKSVIQANPTYCTCVFLLPLSLGPENSFWWGLNKRETRDINWLR